LHEQRLRLTKDTHIKISEVSKALIAKKEENNNSTVEVSTEDTTQATTESKAE
jgi:hypothetical protein